MSKGFKGLKKSVHYLMYSFINLSKAAMDRCSFKLVNTKFLRNEIE